MFDFIDLTIDAEGRPWAAFVDVCNANCSTGEGQENEGVEGFVGTLRTGPALRGDARPLPELPAQLLVPPHAATGSWAPASEGTRSARPVG